MVVHGQIVRVIVAAEALQHHFGATADPESRLAMFVENAAVIDRQAKATHAVTQKSTVVLQRF